MDWLRTKFGEIFAELISEKRHPKEVVERPR
jgi:hypothetical protein